MKVIICPNCGQKMKTKALVRGTILCPSCQVRFTAPEPDIVVHSTPQMKNIGYPVYETLFTIFGLFWIFIFVITGGFHFIWGLITLSSGGWRLLLAPLYLAQLFAALYFLTPILSKLFGQQPSSTAPPLQLPQGPMPHMPLGGTPPAQQQEIHQRKNRKMLFGRMSLLFFFISLLIFIVMGIIFLPVILLLLGGGGFT